MSMPTYEYACRDCSQHLEVVQSFRDEPLTACPTCSGRLRKVYAATGIIFKGSGYYSTDSRAAAAAKADKPKGEAKDGAAEKTAAPEGKGDSATSESSSSTEPAAKSA
jgi:putative FmdB family regulatory protein